MVDRKSTGIIKVDELIEGGFKQGSINMIEGVAGSGKSTIAVQYILEGILKGEKGVYMSVEETKNALFADMNRFGFDLARYEREGMLLFYECSAQSLKDFLERGALGIEVDIREMDAKRLVVDSVSAFTLTYESESKQRIAMQRLFEKIRNWGMTTLIIAESSQDYPPFGLPYLVDGWIKLYYKKVGNERVRTMEVLKMRGTKHKSSETVYRIEDNGINLYPNERVFNVDNN
jgi:circadian clock protein KaiC